jgi:hypothetical protein
MVRRELKAVRSGNHMMSPMQTSLRPVGPSIWRFCNTFLAVVTAALAGAACSGPPPLRYRGLDRDLVTASSEKVLSDTIVYHTVRVDQQGRILPWRTSDLGHAYDDVLWRVWRFWSGIEIDKNGQPYYMNHQVWTPTHDRRGLGGDQLSMALSSWDLYYNYTGDEAVAANMRAIADYSLAHSFSPPTDAWPNLPFPYNTNVESGVGDGDMILGKGFLQPDKAGSFGHELIRLYKKTGDEKYVTAAVGIANTLADKVQPGDADNSPWPFKVNAKTGDVGILVAERVWYEGMEKDLKRPGKFQMRSSYTTNWTGALRMFSSLIALGRGNTSAYQRAFDLTLQWMKTYPVKANKWGPFFEDVPEWSDTQINAVTYATFLLDHPHLDPNWRATVNGILQWVHDELDDDRFAPYGVMVVDEQTAYRQPGNSHSSRQASVELMYWEMTGDAARVANAVRMLNWATYTVDDDGKNFYPTNAIWMTDGYGDYVRHYLRAMAAAPELAPAGADHLLRTTSTVRKIAYQPSSITYTTFEPDAEETFRLAAKPQRVTVDGRTLEERRDRDGDGWIWLEMQVGGVLRIRHTGTTQVAIVKRAS